MQNNLFTQKERKPNSIAFADSFVLNPVQNAGNRARGMSTMTSTLSTGEMSASTSQYHTPRRAE